MAGRVAHAEWTGGLAKGRGEVGIGGETLGLAYTPAWLQEGAGTNPEELLAAAHAASFAMALGAAFSGAGNPAESIRVRSELHLDRQERPWAITRSDLDAEIVFEEDPRLRGTFESEFQRIVADAAANCPVSRALASVEVTVEARPSARAGVPAPSSLERRPADPRHRGDARAKRALEGELIGRIRAGARRRHAPDARPKDTTVALSPPD